MIRKITISLEGAALSLIQELAQEYKIDSHEAVAMCLGYAKSNNAGTYLNDYDQAEGVTLEGVIEDVYEVGQVVGAEYYAQTVYGAVESLDGAKVVLSLTANSIYNTGSKTGKITVDKAVTFTL
jgi:hypothetical protein